MAVNGQRGPSLGEGAGVGIAGVGIAGVGIAGVGRDALPPGLSGEVGRGSDGAAPVVVGALDWLSLAWWVQLYPIDIPIIANEASPQTDEACWRVRGWIVPRRSEAEPRCKVADFGGFRRIIVDSGRACRDMPWI
jgi:hypothetical protein